ncbi:Uncharacterized protein TCM_007918 [Theobroma cacao]|uniref:Uncharacterized protein n=1 Tax=Theobroma cacao TaxID=3641 RepID=A0A061EAJ7_THECC|nr:Uncharacterized protein TCM_007918 [Theobroma cacao]
MVFVLLWFNCVNLLYVLVFKKLYFAFDFSFLNAHGLIFFFFRFYCSTSISLLFSRFDFSFIYVCFCF